MDRTQNLHLKHCKFLDGRDVSCKGANNGILIDVHSARTSISRLSVYTEHLDERILIHTADSFTSVKKCSLHELKSRLALFSGGHIIVESSIFKDSLRPITMTDFEDKTIDQHQSVTDRLTCRNVTFVGCSYTSGSGGAISYSFNDQGFDITNCTFDNCDCSGWGDAIFSTSSAATFTLNDNRFLNSTPLYSLVHMQRGSSPGKFEHLELRNNIFRDIELSGTGEYGAESGGSGLAIRYRSTITLQDCEFYSCSAKRTSGNPACGGGALQIYHSSGNEQHVTLVECIFWGSSCVAEGGGAVMIRYEEGDASHSHVVTIDGCEFELCNATGHGGFLYISETDSIKSLIVSNTTFDSSFASETGGAVKVQTPVTELVRFSGCVFVNGDARGGNGGFIMIDSCSGSVEIEDTTFRDGKATGSGCIHVGNEPKLQRFHVSNCTIDSCESSGTYSLNVKCTDTTLDGLHMKNMKGGKGQIQLSDSGFKDNTIVLSNCSFENYATPKLFSYTSTSAFSLQLIECSLLDFTVSSGNFFNFQDGNFKELSIVGCVLQNLRAQWALFRCGSSKPNVNLLFQDTLFENVYILSDTTSKCEAFVYIQGLQMVTVTNCTFRSNQIRNGILAVEQNGPECSVALTAVVFENCDVKRVNEINQDPRHCLISIRNVDITDFDGCKFISCSYNIDSLLSIDSRFSTPISNCRFENCSCPSNYFVLQLWSSSLDAIENCTFTTMTLSSSVISGNVAFRHTDFSAITIEGSSTLITGPQTYDMENVGIYDCSCNKFFNCRALSATNSNFHSNTIGEFMFSCSETMKFFNCHFIECNGGNSIVFSGTQESETSADSNVTEMSDETTKTVTTGGTDITNTPSWIANVTENSPLTDVLGSEPFAQQFEELWD